MASWLDLAGTVLSYLRLGKTGVRLKDSSGNLEVRNPSDTADAEVTASRMNASGDSIRFNSRAAGTGADQIYTLQRPSAGMTGTVTITLPDSEGSPGQAIIRDASVPGKLVWGTIASGNDKPVVDTTSLAFGSTSPVTMFTLPANAVVTQVEVIVDTSFNGAPSMSVGISGTTSKYMGSSDVDLTSAAETSWTVHPKKQPVGTTESLIITYAAGGATAGAARVLVTYVIPS